MSGLTYNDMYQNVRFNPFQPYVSDLKTHDIVIYDPFIPIL